MNCLELVRVTAASMVKSLLALRPIEAHKSSYHSARDVYGRVHQAGHFSTDRFERSVFLDAHVAVNGLLHPVSLLSDELYEFVSFSCKILLFPRNCSCRHDFSRGLQTGSRSCSSAAGVAFPAARATKSGRLRILRRFREHHAMARSVSIQRKLTKARIHWS
jgi:hypothetical protein